MTGGARPVVQRPRARPRCSPAFNALGRRLTPSDYAERIQRQARRGRQPARAGPSTGCCPCKVIGFGVGLVARPAPRPAHGRSAFRVRRSGVVVVASLLGYYGPNLYLYQKGYDRTQQMQRDLPDAIDLLTISVEAGLGFDAALRPGGAQHRRPAGRASSPGCCRRCRSAWAAPSALRALGERTNLARPPLASSRAMVQADAFGIPVGQVLRVQSAEIRRQAPAAGRGEGPEGARSRS